MQRSQASRRSACDKCRMNKLRCERLPLPGNSCERCLRTGAACVSTTNGADRRSRGDPHSSPRRRSSNAMDQNGGPWSTPTTIASGDQRMREATTQLPDAGSWGMQREIGSALSHDDDDLHNSDDEFALANFNFADSSMTQRTSPERGEPAPQKTLASPFIHNLSDSSHSGVRLTPPLMGSVADGPSNPLQDLFELSANLVHDYEMMIVGDLRSPDPGSPNPMETAIQQALSRTSLFSSILNAVAVDVPSAQQRTGDAPAARIQPSLSPLYHPVSTSSFMPQASRAVRATSERVNQSDHPINITYAAGLRSTDNILGRQSQDIVFTTTLVTAYIFLMRIWRCVFSRLHHLLLTTPLGKISGLLMLPSLQLGSFHIQDNPSIQIIVLLESCSGMLQRIESSLGIVSAANHGLRSVREDSQAKWPVLNLDPVAVSIRETLLTQERLRRAVEDSLGELSLKEIMDRIKKQLET